MRPWIAFPPGCDIAVADDIPDRVARLQRSRETGEPSVLRGSKPRIVRAFELNADGEIVAARAPLPARVARVPRAAAARHELEKLAVATDEKVRGYLSARDRCVVRMRGGIEPVGEELGDARPAELPRRQADVMDNEEAHRASARSRVAVRRGDEGNACRQPLIVDNEGRRGCASSLPASPCPPHRCQPLESSSSLIPSRSMR